nr:ribose/galactose isomerase [Perkinsus chesapeaki]
MSSSTPQKLLFEPAAARLQNGLKLVFGSDHAGIDLKNEMIDFVKNTLKAPEGSITDVGTYTHDSVDYPDFAEKTCKTLLSTSDDTSKALGVVICGSGLGISMSANKCKGIRCALCSSNYDARYSRLHNNANVLAMGGRTTGVEVAREILATYINTDFEGGRHQKRIDKMMALEQKD